MDIETLLWILAAGLATGLGGLALVLVPRTGRGRSAERPRLASAEATYFLASIETLRGFGTSTFGA